MMSIVYVFWMYVILFAVIGAMRGWAKELLVAFSVILSLALNHVLRRYIPIARDLGETDPSLFWVRTLILLVLVYFGYQTVVSIPHLASRAAREKLQDTLFGAILGGFNGYLIAGTILYYINVADYPFQDVVSKPADPNVLQAVNQMMLYMPPQLLGEPAIYFAIILAFVFVLVVYI
ncbi:MAG: CvpA family protein [Anaerolineales bacterium]|nr:CvpA family protein [Anaerolineales bacterium]NUQ84700.1 CvpA family protein [Anaerolineales bacterium]